MAHEHAHKKREELEEKCAVAQERWKEQKERTQERGKIAMNRIQFLVTTNTLKMAFVYFLPIAQKRTNNKRWGN